MHNHESWMGYVTKKIEQLYQEKAPDKLSKLPANFTKHKDKEAELLQKVLTKYKEPMEIPPYPLRNSLGKIFLTPDVFANDGGSYPEIDEDQFPPNVAVNMKPEDRKIIPPPTHSPKLKPPELSNTTRIQKSKIQGKKKGEFAVPAKKQKSTSGDSKEKPKEDTNNR
eukprot:UN01239